MAKLLLLAFGLFAFNLPAADSAADPQPLRQGYALLFKLLDDEKNVSKLLIIKRERAELRELVKAISDRCGDAHKQIEKWSKQDKLEIKGTGLPIPEVKTRESISKARAKELLGQKGTTFELRLLLTQNEALGYGEHLAATVAGMEMDPTRGGYLRQLSADLRGLQQRVLTLLERGYSAERPGR